MLIRVQCSTRKARIFFGKNTGSPCLILNTDQHGQNTEFLQQSVIDLNHLEKTGTVLLAFRAMSIKGIDPMAFK